VLDAVHDLLAERAPRDIQVKDIADHAQVSLAAIYRYFASKEHLYAAALLTWAADFPRARPAATNGAATNEAQLRALMRRAARAFEHYPQMMRVEIVLESSTDPNARALFDEFAGNNRRALMDALSSVDADTAAAIVETVNSVFVTRLRSWALGRATIRDVDRSVQSTLDLIFAAPFS
jgi:AcrR family transcriptional regulator